MSDSHAANRMDRNSGPTKIMVVDDLPEKLLVYETVLSSLGEEMVLVSSGAQALKQVLQHQFAVILLDVNMPDMDGFETARLIRSHRKSRATPIIFLTAFTDEVRTAEGYASGAVDYLPTPVEPEILRSKVRVFVELFKMRQQVAQRAEEQARRVAAEDANLRLTFLSDASAILGRSLNFQTTARNLAQMPVPFLAEMSLLTLVPGLVATDKKFLVQIDSEEAPQITELASIDALPAPLQQSILRARETGCRVDVPDNAENAAPGWCYTSIPLQARNRTFAILTLGCDRSDTDTFESDMTLAVALASRAAPALDNALLYEELQKADRQKIDFLSMLAHELRNPLAPICNAVQLMRMSLKDDDTELQWAGDVIDRRSLKWCG